MAGGESGFSKVYAEACKSVGTHPLANIKVGFPNSTLEFVADRIRLRDWRPLLKALCSDNSLHFIAIKNRHSLSNYLDCVRSEAKALELKRGPVLLTRFLMSLLTESISTLVASSSALTCLQLDRLPLVPDFASLLAKGLGATRSLQHLSLRHCPLGEEGTGHLCKAVSNRPSILTLELVDCGISSTAAKHVADMIKFQEMARYGETWMGSLRYRAVDRELLPGLRRITLNSNPEIGDDGLQLIVEVLLDDMWIKAIDMQDCGIGEPGGRAVLDLVSRNPDIVVFDVRRNGIENFHLVREILEALGRNTREDKYLWLETEDEGRRGRGSSSAASSIGLLSSRSSVSVCPDFTRPRAMRLRSQPSIVHRSVSSSRIAPSKRIISSPRLRPEQKSLYDHDPRFKRSLKNKISDDDIKVEDPEKEEREEEKEEPEGELKREEEEEKSVEVEEGKESRQEPALEGFSFDRTHRFLSPQLEGFLCRGSDTGNAETGGGDLQPMIEKFRKIRFMVQRPGMVLIGGEEGRGGEASRGGEGGGGGGEAPSPCSSPSPSPLRSRLASCVSSSVSLASSPAPTPTHSRCPTLLHLFLSKQ